MNIIFLFLIGFKSIYSNINFLSDFKAFISDNFMNKNLIDQNATNESLIYFLDNVTNFNMSNDEDMDLYNECTNYGEALFKKTDGIYNFLYFLSYSGKEFSDLGQEHACTQNNFSYYLFSYNHNPDYNKDNKNNIFKFLEKENFYTGICLFDKCTQLFQKMFDGYIGETIHEVKVQQIIDEDNILNKEEIDCEKNLEDCKYLPYYYLDENGNFDENEKTKYKKFSIIIIIIIIILCLEIIISLFIYCGYNLYNNSHNFMGELYEESDLDDEENSEEEQNEQIFYSNSSSSKEKRYESCFQKFIKILYKYFSFITKIIVLTMRKSKFYNNKNMKIITKLRLCILILISFSINFNVYIKVPSKGFYNEDFFKEFYFIFLKFASFGLDMYICLDGFEVMFKLMNYYKKYFFDKGNHTMSLKGIFKFFLFSIYKILSYIVLFFIVNYFNRYYIYMHSGGTLYTYYSNTINNKGNDFQIFHPKYTILLYFYGKNIDDKILASYKISLLFINEFISYIFVLIIFYVGNILKSRIYECLLLLYVFICFILSYPLCLIMGEIPLNTYNIIIRKISLVKYPLIFFNHYLFGAIAGLICFYFKDSTNNNSMINEPNKCPFSFSLKIVSLFDYLIQKGKKKIFLIISIIIQILICISFTIIINFNDDIEQTMHSTFLKICYYYESGIFIFTFCFNTILFFAHNTEEKNSNKFSILNIIYQINFSYINTIYLMMYSYYCYFGFQLKLTYQNLWFITFGLFIFCCMENIVITILLIMPFKIIFKSLLDKYLIISSNILSLEAINEKVNKNKFNNSGLSKELDNNFEDDDFDKNDSFK